MYRLGLNFRVDKTSMSSLMLYFVNVLCGARKGENDLNLGQSRAHKMNYLINKAR